MNSSISPFAKLLTAFCFVLLSSSNAFGQANDYEDNDYGQDEISLSFSKSDIKNSSELISLNDVIVENFETIEGINEYIDDNFDYGCEECQAGKCNADKGKNLPSDSDVILANSCTLAVNISEKNKQILNIYSDLQLSQVQASVNKKNEILNHTAQIYSSQRLQTTVIFFIAHLILIGGFIAALFELKKAHDLRTQGGKMRENLVKDNQTLQASDIDVTLGYDKIALKTSINGVAIFIITIFFYLIYIMFVYPIFQSSESPKKYAKPNIENTQSDKN